MDALSSSSPAGNRRDFRHHRAPWRPCSARALRLPVLRAAPSAGPVRRRAGASAPDGPFLARSARGRRASRGQDRLGPAAWCARPSLVASTAPASPRPRISAELQSTVAMEATMFCTFCSKEKDDHIYSFITGSLIYAVSLF
jgi:hypothetical protein